MTTINSPRTHERNKVKFLTEFRDMEDQVWTVNDIIETMKLSKKISNELEKALNSYKE